MSGADHATACADILRCAKIDYTLAQSESERVEAILTQVTSLFEIETYFQGRAAGIVRNEEYSRARRHRLAAQARLLEEVKADPAVIRRHYEMQVVAGKKRDESVAGRLQGGLISGDEIVLAAEELNSEARLAGC